jgi:hypothetical protein
MPKSDSTSIVLRVKKEGSAGPPDPLGQPKPKRHKKSSQKKSAPRNETQQQQVENFRLITHTSEAEAVKWLEHSDWKTGSALQGYFQFRAAEASSIDLTEDSDAITTDHDSTGGLGAKLLNSHYGRFLANIKRIEFTGLTQLTLPRVVVIGNESSGKSSTLERIAMFPFFPRDRDLCTRMPIKLCLRNDDSADPTTVLVRFQTETKTVAVEKAAITIADWMEEIVRKRNGGSLVGFVDEEIIVEVRNSCVPTLVSAVDKSHRNGRPYESTTNLLGAGFDRLAWHRCSIYPW